jgi:hypothetical protein
VSFSATPAANIVDREIAAFSSDRGVKDHLKQQVTKFFDKVEGVAVSAAGVDRIEGFVSFSSKYCDND